MKVLFIGSQKLGLHCVSILYEQGDEIVGIITFEPESHERWGKEVRDFAVEHKIPCMIPKNINDPVVIKKIRTLSPEIIYVIGWRWIIGKSILDIPRFGCVGIHFSLLPKLRGSAPVSWSIISGEKKTGLTLFFFNKRADAGDIIAQLKTSISIYDDANTLRERLEKKAIETIKKYAPLLRKGKAPRRKQKELKASYAPRRWPALSEIDWDKSSREIYDVIRATTFPYPGAYTYYAGRKLIIWESLLLAKCPKYIGVPGQIILRKRHDGVIIKTGDHAILVKIVQPEGALRMRASEWIKSTKERLG